MSTEKHSLSLLESIHPTLDIRISVEKLGPIDRGSVTLRPLTIFVGPSNTGKTYLAIVIYALHRVLRGFHRIPFIEDYLFSRKVEHYSEKEFENFLSKVQADSNNTFFSDLPKFMSEITQNVFRDEQLLTEDVRIELMRCFDLEFIHKLTRVSEEGQESKISVSVSEYDEILWNYLVNISNTSIQSEGRIHNPRLFPSGQFKQKDIDRIISALRRNERAIVQSETRFSSTLLWRTLFESRMRQVEACYLPAARSGIMQSHRVIASALVQRATRGGLERFVELPTFSGVLADFLQKLIFVEDQGSGFSFSHRGRPDKSLRNLAGMLEDTTLGGKIKVTRFSGVAFPEFEYTPKGTSQAIPLSRASSMVTELAPVILFLRSNVSRGDTLIIEEPESHLHPAAQTEIAQILAHLVRNDVRVIVTTHSDWLLQAISNLMREGELAQQAKLGRSEADERFPSYLHPRDVGIWLFSRNSNADGSVIREIEFDRVDGIAPADYDDVAEQLFNRSADLQNQIEERAKER